MNDEQIESLKKEIQKCVKEIEEIINNVNFSDEKDLADSVTTAYDIYQNFPKSEHLAEVCMSILRELAKNQEDTESLKETVSTAYSIYQNFPKSEQLASQYTFILEELAKNQNDIKELKETIDTAYDVYRKFSDSEDVACGYLSTLSWLLGKKYTLKSLKEIVSTFYNIYQKFPKSEELAYGYGVALTWLSGKEDTLEELKKIVDKAQDLYESFPKSEKIAQSYIVTLTMLSGKEDNSEELEDTIRRVVDVYQHSSNTKSTNKLVASIIFKYIDKFIINSSKEHKDKFNILSGWLSNLNTELIVAVIDEIFSWSEDLLISTNHEVYQIMSRLLSYFSNIVSFQQTKYAILIKSLRSLENKVYDSETLIKIYYMVQTIKFQLSMKNLSEEDFGHYTSGEVLQILLKQSSDKKKRYSIEGRTRLGNVKYMNDPEEGSVLDRYLELGEQNNLEISLKPSPWFLMSLTTSIDDLAMWSQYGARAEGVCLVFKADSFKVVKSMVETEWMFKKNCLPIFGKKSEDTKDDEMDLSYKKDFLYRICYLDEELLKNGDFMVVNQDNNKMLDKTEIATINNCLDKIKSIVSRIEKNTILYSVVGDCLEEIRYLFKVSDYSYESELRILRYADLTPENKEIKIDNSGPVAKLYLERDMPVQLKQVIFGPKFSNPEHVTPLLQLLDKDINFKRSDRKFK